MRKIKLNGHKLEIFDDIAELSIERFHQYSRYSLIASGIGDSLSDVDNHISTINELLTRDVAKAQQELFNLRQNLLVVLDERDYRHKSFMFFIHTIDGEEWTDFTDAGIDELYQKFNSARMDEFNKVLNKVVEDVDEQMQRYFPEMFEDATEKNYMDLVRKRALLQADEALNGSDHSKEISELSTRIWEKYEPKSFENDKAIVEFDRQFENMCLILSKEFQGGVKGYTVMEFYSAYNLLKEREKEMKKLNKKKK